MPHGTDVAVVSGELAVLVTPQYEPESAVMPATVKASVSSIVAETSMPSIGETDTSELSNVLVPASLDLMLIWYESACPCVCVVSGAGFISPGFESIVTVIAELAEQAVVFLGIRIVW